MRLHKREKRRNSLQSILRSVFRFPLSHQFFCQPLRSLTVHILSHVDSLLHHSLSLSHFPLSLFLSLFPPLSLSLSLTTTIIYEWDFVPWQGVQTPYREATSETEFGEPNSRTNLSYISSVRCCRGWGVAHDTLLASLRSVLFSLHWLTLAKFLLPVLGLFGLAKSSPLSSCNNLFVILSNLRTASKLPYRSLVTILHHNNSWSSTKTRLRR